MPEKKDDGTLSLNDLLIAEYEYISNTALAGKDSDIPKSVINFDITAFIGAVAVILGNKLSFDDNSFTFINLIFIIFFLWLWIRGIATVIQIANLRSAWHESMMALNYIKDFYMRRFPEATNAILWKTYTLPAKYKKSSASYILTLQVSILSSLAFSASVGLLLFLIGIKSAFWIYFISLFLGIMSFYGHLALYKRSLYL